MIVVAHNLPAMNAQRQFNITEKKKAKNVEKLSSGYKINRAADDAAGLSISEKLRNQIRNLHQSMNNIDDGINFCKTGEGALNECHAMLNRLEELAVKAANDVNTEIDRKSIEDETKQLQEEIRKTFRLTQFNGRKYFSEPYMPEMVGDTDDIHVYNTSTGQYGGIMLDNIRFSWDEMKAFIQPDDDGNIPSDIFEADGETYTGVSIGFWNPSADGSTPENGSEWVEFEFPKGEKAPILNRKYTWEAKDDGIHMNNRYGSPTVSWGDLNPAIDPSSTESVPSGEYSFKYRDTVIYFEVPQDAKFEDVVAGMNNPDMLEKINWSNRFDGTDQEKGIDIIDYKKKAFITNEEVLYIDGKKNASIKVFDDTNTQRDENGNNIELLKADLPDINNDNSGIKIQYASYDTLRGDDRALLEQSGNLDKVKKWTDFGDEYPISDFNRAPYTGKTLGESEIYGFMQSDNKLGIDFAFKLSDEVGLEIAKSGIETEIKSVITAPVKLELIESDQQSYYTHCSSAEIDVSFNLQRNCHKSFDDMSEAFPCYLDEPVKNEDGDNVFRFAFYDKNGTQLGANNKPIPLIYAEQTIKQKDLLYACDTGSKLNFNFSAEENQYGESFNVKFDVAFDPFKTTKGYGEVLSAAQNAKDNMYLRTYQSALATARDYYNTHQETVTNSDGTVSMISFENSNYRRSTEQQRIDSATTASNVEYERVYKEQYTVKLEEYANKCFYGGEEILEDGSRVGTGLGGVEFKATHSEQPYQTFYLEEESEGNVAVQTDFNVLMNPTEKGLYIQSGANSGEDTYLSWDSLNLNVLGLGSANVSTREKATRFISHVQYASKVVSDVRSRIGAQQNRLEYAYNANSNYTENLERSESNIRDTDMAEEAMRLGKHSILEQAGQAMMAQANQQNQGILQLIQS